MEPINIKDIDLSEELDFTERNAEFTKILKIDELKNGNIFGKVVPFWTGYPVLNYQNSKMTTFQN